MDIAHLWITKPCPAGPREQKAREERQRMRRERGLEYDPAEDGGGSFDEGDPSTTNLYVGNLAPDVDEEACSQSCSVPSSNLVASLVSTTGPWRAG